MAKGFNGGIIGSRNLTTGGGIGQGTAVGIWSMNEAQIAKLAGIWPQEVGQGQVLGVQVFTESTTWTPPTGVTSVDYMVIAGGGGGGMSDGFGSAGGAGGFQSGTGLSVTPSTPYTIIVGAGGAGASTLRSEEHTSELQSH